MLKRSMMEVAHEQLLQKETPQYFKDMWLDVCETLDLGEKEKQDYISRFYTELSLDERFVLLEDNQWDLRERQEFSKVHIDMNDIYSEIEEEEKEIEEEANEENYDEFAEDLDDDSKNTILDDDQESEDEEEEEY